MSAVSTLYAEVGTDWISRLGLQLDTTREILDRRLLQTTASIPYLQYQQNTVRKLREVAAAAAAASSPNGIRERFTRLREGEALLRTLSAETQEWEKEGKGQILYTQEWAKPLNEIPHVLPATAFFKVFLVPLFAVLLPIAMFFLPYFISKYMFGVSMSFDEYKAALGLIWSNSGSWGLGGESGWGQLRKLFQYGWFLFGIIQNIYQPIQQALHIRVIQTTMLHKGQILRTFFREVASLCVELSLPDFTADLPDEPLRLYAYVREYPLLIQGILRSVATAELNWSLATCPDLCFIEYVGGSAPVCQIRAFCDPSIPNGIVSDFSAEPSRTHCLVTGPNKGGKSSSLRAVLLNIWLAQTLGVAFADSMRLRPFDWIESGLRIADTPGQRSLFERELLFAKRALAHNGVGTGFVIFDELFHSTNPPDGERTARLFLGELWKQPSVCSLVSTHVFSLVKTSPSHVQRLCVPAEVTSEQIHYSFHLTPGLCTVSSVSELYKEHGFPYGCGEYGGRV